MVAFLTGPRKLHPWLICILQASSPSVCNALRGPDCNFFFHLCSHFLAQRPQLNKGIL
uniref:Uncharacterized protein n=1 Tax=Arundo donax TaxID=35708 RepID=A0A0A9BV31_ARUDO